MRIQYLQIIRSNGGVPKRSAAPSLGCLGIRAKSSLPVGFWSVHFASACFD